MVNRVIEITPPGTRTDVDSIVLTAGKSWQSVLSEVENSLDAQWNQMNDGEKEWKDIGVTVRCREVSDEELARLKEE